MVSGKYSYVKIAETIGRDIRDGKYAVSGSFPSLTQIMQRFEVSRVTASRSVDELKKKGIVSCRPGQGAYVTPQARMLGGSLGFVVPGLCYAEIFPPICRQISRLAQERGLNLLFGDIVSENPAKRAEMSLALARKFAAEGVLGVFFQPLEHVKDAERINRDILAVFDEAKIPVVLIDSDVVPSPRRSAYDLVGINNFDAGRSLALHLVERGARHIGFVKKAYCDFSVQNRYEGVRNVVLAQGGTLAELTIDPGNADAVRKALARRPRFDAIICRNDHQAAHLLASLRKIGKRVPEDVLVAGFNDVEYASILNPALTTVRLPCGDIACAAFDLLMARVENPHLPPRECYLPSALVVRASTGDDLPQNLKRRSRTTKAKRKE